MTPFITIGIVNWNGKSLLRKCLESLFDHTDYPSYRVVVVDNGSSDGSRQMLSEDFPQVAIIKNDKNLGFSTANNQIFENFPYTDYYLLLNNDVEITNDGWLRQFVDVAERTGAGITGCRLIYPDGSLQHGGGIIRPGRSAGVDVNSQNKTEFGKDDSEEWSPDYVSGAAFLVHKNVIEEVGGFDERYSPAFYEETDMCVKAKKKGYEIIYTPKVELIHRTGSSINSVPEFYFRNQLQFILLHFSFNWLIRQIPYEVRNFIGHVYHSRKMKNIYLPIIIGFRDIIAERFCGEDC